MTGVAREVVRLQSRVAMATMYLHPCIYIYSMCICLGVCALPPDVKLMYFWLLTVSLES